MGKKRKLSGYQKASKNLTQSETRNFVHVQEKKTCTDSSLLKTEEQSSDMQTEEVPIMFSVQDKKRRKVQLELKESIKLEDVFMIDLFSRLPPESSQRYLQQERRQKEVDEEVDDSEDNKESVELEVIDGSAPTEKQMRGKKKKIKQKSPGHEALLERLQAKLNSLKGKRNDVYEKRSKRNLKKHIRRERLRLQQKEESGGLLEQKAKRVYNSEGKVVSSKFDFSAPKLVEEDQSSQDGQNIEDVKKVLMKMKKKNEANLGMEHSVKEHHRKTVKQKPTKKVHSKEMWEKRGQQDENPKSKMHGSQKKRFTKTQSKRRSVSGF